MYTGDIYRGYIGNIIIFPGFGVFLDFLMFFNLFRPPVVLFTYDPGLRHTTLTRRIDPRYPEGPKSPKPKKSGFQKVRFWTPFLYYFLLRCFFEKVDLIWPLRPIPSVEKTRKWIL